MRDVMQLDGGSRAIEAWEEPLKGAVRGTHREAHTQGHRRHKNKESTGDTL